MPESTENAPANAAGATETNAQAQEVKDLPAWAQEVIRNTRQEAADYRVRLQNAKQEVTSVVKDEFQAQLDELTKSKSDVTQQLSDSKLDHLKLQVALNEAKLGGEQAVEFADRLRGNTLDELKADATKALKVFGNVQQPATDPSQGHGNAPNRNVDDIFGEFFSKQYEPGK